MARETVQLIDGYPVGAEHLKSAVLQTITTQMLIEAQAESERVVATPDGYQLVESPTLMAIHVLRRQVVKFGEGAEAVSGPIEMADFIKLSPADHDLLREAAERLDVAETARIAAELKLWGRAEGEGAAS